MYIYFGTSAATDFNLIKDIVERNLDAEEEEINHTVTVPLYLGLMGTMMGIVFGLINLFLVSDPNADFDIKAFLGGVSIAMFASFWGLFCTVGNSSFILKAAKRNLESNKNIFYTFLQTELLPVINQSISNSIYSLHANLVKFNDGFATNLDRLYGLLTKNHDALIAQERILEVLENIDINEYSRANVKVLAELKSGIEQLAKFNQYLNSLNYLVNGTSRLTESFESLLNRSDNFKLLAEKLDLRVEESNKLIQFLNGHFSQLDERGRLIKEAVVDVEDTMIKSLGQLETHTQTKIDAIKQITIKEEDLMTKAFAENRSHISKLSLLEDLNTNITGLKKSFVDELDNLKTETETNNKILEAINSQLEILNEQTKNGGIVGAFRKSWKWLTAKK